MRRVMTRKSSMTQAVSSTHRKHTVAKNKSTSPSESSKTYQCLSRTRAWLTIEMKRNRRICSCHHQKTPCIEYLKDQATLLLVIMIKVALNCRIGAERSRDMNKTQIIIITVNLGALGQLCAFLRSRHVPLDHHERVNSVRPKLGQITHRISWNGLNFSF